jgi:uncharacterized membrane protein
MKGQTSMSIVSKSFSTLRKTISSRKLARKTQKVSDLVLTIFRLSWFTIPDQYWPGFKM